MGKGEGMKYIELEHKEGVAIVKLNRGVINALNMHVLREMGDVLQDIKDDPRVCALVITSANDKFFSIGFDLPELYPLPPQEFAAFFRTYNFLCLDLYRFPKPTIAALTGHATAGGCIMALCADYRFMADGRRLIGVNEIRLGVPITYLAYCIFQQLLGEIRTREVVYSGELYPPQEALQLGMVDQVFVIDEVVSAATEKASDLGKMLQGAFALDKRLRVRAIEAQVLSYLEEEERVFLAQWLDPDAQLRLREAMEKFIPKG